MSPFLVKDGLQRVYTNAQARDDDVRLESAGGGRVRALHQSPGFPRAGCGHSVAVYPEVPVYPPWAQTRSSCRMDAFLLGPDTRSTAAASEVATIERSKA